ncbi:nitrogen fixation-related uncharacterized protein [Evansella vedderi]|uniref:Nitrogen fixation-related uncharacterized protein n=1 Tax=Evansella vedderi TaxID=38282 RepID=A0ABT9ZXV1_9BACI|nr:hypothetical protein [Evansella vedderi]MDQ0256066.1 nitrogen fixation-related uncharacterized protein [Evansella vedderi]
MTWFLITIAPPLVLIACIFIVFWWATAARPPAFVLEDQYEEEIDENHKVNNL